MKYGVPSLKLTIFAPENGWLEDDPFLLGFGLFSGAKMLLVSGRLFCPQKADQPRDLGCSVSHVFLRCSTTNLFISLPLGIQSSSENGNGS